MTSQQQLARAKPRRAANNNYQKLSKTLYEKLTKLCREYDTDIYFLAHRNGRFNGFVSKDKTGQPWLPPDADTLRRAYPPPVIKSPSNVLRIRCGRDHNEIMNNQLIPIAISQDTCRSKKSPLHVIRPMLGLSHLINIHIIKVLSSRSIFPLRSLLSS